MVDIQNLINSHKSRLDAAEKKMSKLQDRLEHNRTEIKNDKSMGKKENMGETADTVKT